MSTMLYISAWEVKIVFAVLRTTNLLKSFNYYLYSASAPAAWYDSLRVFFCYKPCSDMKSL